MSKVRSLHNYSATCHDEFTVWQMAEQLKMLSRIPAEDLAKVKLGNKSGHLIMWESFEKLRAKLVELDSHARAQRFTQDLIGNGRPRA